MTIKYSISRSTLQRAEKLGLFKFQKHKVFLSPEQKEKISVKRKEWLRNNPNKHPWKRKDKQISIPCEYLKSKLDKANIKYVEEYSPIKDRFFSIDISMPDIKVGIEVNGNQHYTNEGKLTKYYQDRHDLIVSHGWRLLEITSSSIMKSIDEIVENILNITKQSNFDFKVYTKEYQISMVKKIQEEKRKERKIKKNKFINNRINIIMKSEVNFLKFKWVGQIAKLLNISSTQVKRFMEKYMSNFYDKCYKRKSIGSVA